MCKISSKKIIRNALSVFLFICILVSAMLSICSCSKTEQSEPETASNETASLTDTETASEPAEPETVPEDAVETGAENSVTGTGSETFSLRDASEYFSDVHAHSSHAEYTAYIDAETENMKNAVTALHEKIIAALIDKYQNSIANATPSCSYEKYCEEYIAPYEQYFHERMEAAENAKAAYYGIASAAIYGGNMSGDYALLLEYAHYRNLYNELCDLRNLINNGLTRDPTQS